ncbi:cation transporter [Streptococcus pantholopis]|uniref:Cation transporter n=1 Tax=Streptococcus pantholopis TaxID=1811193 RepID=A0A172Q887_9STRE|nr:cation transporter [Streptococcus pantholopis]AND79684.1 cation transporter [Streptococcus pantholopis]
MNQKAIEKRSLMVSTFGNGFMGAAGVIVYVVTDLNALLLDAVFSVITFISSVMAFYISKNSKRRTASFPNGMYFLEPLYAFIKSVATLMLLIIALLESAANAYAYFMDHIGHPINSGPVLPYTSLMVLISFSLAAYNRRQNEKIGNMSTILEAEAKGNFADGLISAGVGLAFFLLYFIDIKGTLGFLHYTGDFFVTAVLVAVSIKEPVQTLITSFKEFAYSTTQDHYVIERVHHIFAKHLADEKENLNILIFKQGMNISIKVYVLALEEPEFIDRLLQNKDDVSQDLEKTFEHFSLEYSF